MLHFLDVTLSNLIAKGVGTVPILRKNTNTFPLFPFVNIPSQMIK